MSVRMLDQNQQEVQAFTVEQRRMWCLSQAISLSIHVLQAHVHGGSKTMPEFDKLWLQMLGQVA